MKRKQITIRLPEKVWEILDNRASTTGKSINDTMSDAILYSENSQENTYRDIKAAACDIIEKQNKILLDGVRKIIREEMVGCVQIDVKKSHKC